MNYSIIRYIICSVMEFQAIFLTLPCLIALYYKEKEGWVYFFVLLGSFLLGRLGKIRKPKTRVFYAKDGFVIVSISWIVLSIIGAFPLFLTGDIPSFTNALFESVSGFTTTGATILTDVEALSKCSLFWRCFTNWIGGMGVLVFIVAIRPLAGGYNMHLMRAESTGPSVGKLVPRVRYSARILYAIYFSMTILLILLLYLAGTPFFEAVTMSFGTAGTGGFGVLNTSVASYTPAIQVIVTIFMILFGINFNVFYLFLIRKPLQALKHEEFRYYVIIIAVAIAAVTTNIIGYFDSIWEALRHAAFQVGSIITTTGYTTTDYVQWPVFSQTILILIMFIGACAGSTGGGMKISRAVIMFRIVKNEISYLIHPKRVRQVYFEDRVVSKEVFRSVQSFFMLYCLIYVVSLLLVSLDGFDFFTGFSAVTTLFNNVGPGFGLVGPTGNFDIFSVPVKLVLIFDMLAGRLELFPIIILFSPSVWKK